MNALRILYVGMIPPEQGGRIACGVAFQSWDLAVESVRRGYDVTLAAVSDRARVYEEEGVRIWNTRRSSFRKAVEAVFFLFRIRAGDRLRMKFLTWKERIAVLAGAAEMKKALERIRPDLIFVHTLTNHLGLSLQFLPSSAPVIFSDHGFWQDVRSDRDLAKVKMAVDSARFLISVSAYCRKMQGNMDLAESIPGRVIPNPLPLLMMSGKTPEEAVLPAEAIRRTVLFVGGVESRRKGLDILLEALSSDPELGKSVRLVVVAPDEGKEMAEQAARKSGLDIRAFGPVPHERLLSLYRDSDVLVLPSRSEAFPLVLLESLGSGTPVVGFAPAVEELRAYMDMDVGETFDADREDAADLGRKIRAVLARSFDRDTLRARIRDRMSWDRIFPLYEDVFREVTG